MFKESKYNRRQFLGSATMAFAASGFSLNSFSATKSSNPNSTNASQNNSHMSNNSFELLKQINAGELNIGYAEAGSANAPVVSLLHGWPYDITSFVDVAPLLTAKGYRVIVPYLRGFGTTTFLSKDTVRNGQQSVIAIDIINLMDALKIQKAIIAGFDWGARTANIMAALLSRAL